MRLFQYKNENELTEGGCICRKRVRWLDYLGGCQKFEVHGRETRFRVWIEIKELRRRNGEEEMIVIFILFFKLLMGFLSAIWYVRNTNENINSIFLILLLFPPEITSEIWPSHPSSVKSWWNIFLSAFSLLFSIFGYPQSKITDKRKEDQGMINIIIIISS